jgi:hypothetical protein
VPVTLPTIESSGVAKALTFIGVLEVIGGIISGFIVGGGSDGKPVVGFMVFAGGILGGLILFGFAQVIQHTKESAQRLSRIEMIMQRSYDK